MSLSACDYIESLRRRTVNSNDVVVSIDDHMLYRKDIERMVPPGTSYSDSIAIVNDFVKSWATDILMYRNAKRNVKNEDEIRRLLEDYERTITIHYYRQNMVQEKVEMPTDVEAESFYHMHQSEFLLKEPAIRGVIVALPLANGRVVKLRRQMQNPEKNIADIEKFAMQNALVYSLFDEDWQLLSNVEASTGCKIKVKGTGYYEFMDTVSVNMVFISDYVPAGEPAPFQLIKEEAKLRLFQIRKMQFLRNIDDEIYEYALKHEDIKFNVTALPEIVDTVKQNLKEEDVTAVGSTLENEGNKKIQKVDVDNKSSKTDAKKSPLIPKSAASEQVVSDTKNSKSEIKHQHIDAVKPTANMQAGDSNTIVRSKATTNSKVAVTSEVVEKQSKVVSDTSKIKVKSSVTDTIR